MKISLRLASLALLLALVFLPVQSAAAQGINFDGQVIFGQSYTLKSGNSMDGDLLVFGGSAAIEEGATVNGDVIIFGGSLSVDGEVTGNIAVTGGTVSLSATAHVYGDLATVGATLNRTEGSQIDGQIYNTATSWIDGTNAEQPVIPDVPAVTVEPTIPTINIGGWWNSLMNVFSQAVGLAVLAMLLMLFLAPHADRVAHAVLAQPLTAGGLGLLTVIVAPIALVLLVITLILIPVAAIAVVALIVAGVFGWIALGYEIGQRFTKAIHQNWHPAFSAGLGTFALSLASSALTSIPVLNCIGWLVPFLLGLAALGAVLMTRFGTQAVTAPVKETAVTPIDPAE